VGLFAPVRDHVDRSPSVQRGALTAARERAFISARLLGGLFALAVPAVYLMMRGAPGLPEIISCIVFASLGASILIAHFRSRTGRYRPLHAEEDRLLAQGMTDVVTRHGRGGTVLVASPAAQSLFGAKVADLLGHGLFDRVHVADRPAYLTALADAAGRGESRSTEFRVRRNASGPHGELPGRFVWVEMRCRPLDRGPGEGDPEVVAVMRDVTERKAQEQALEDARMQAERANVAKSRYLATMSHELRTPLNAIIGFSEMLTKEDVLLMGPQRRQEYAQLIHDSGRHLLSVVNGILDMSKIESGNFEITPEPLALEHVIADARDMLALKAREAGIEVAVRLPQKLPRVVADRRALSQIMLNLLSNAIKFTDRGGRIAVRAQAQDAAIAVAVEDDGVGIGPEDLPYLGDPFFQARSSYDRRHDGTGLGLSIVKGLLALHGGRLEIESRLGQGTRVTFCLPVDCRTASGAEKPRPVIERLARRSTEEPDSAPVRKRA